MIRGTRTWVSLITLIQRLSGQRVSPTDVKARRYVGQFFNRRRSSLKTGADVEGNQRSPKPARRIETYHRFRALKDEFRRRLGAWSA